MSALVSEKIFFPNTIGYGIFSTEYGTFKYGKLARRQKRNGKKEEVVEEFRKISLLLGST